MKVSSDFRLTVPVKIRKQLGIHSGTEVEFIIIGDEVFLRKFNGNRLQKNETKISSDKGPLARPDK